MIEAQRLEGVPMLDDGALTGDRKADFTRIYNQPDPRAYFRTLNDLEYQVPQQALPIFEAVLAAAVRGGRPRTVLDVCCSYGINAALLRCDVDLGEIGARPAGPARERKSGAEGERGGLGDWSSDVFSSDLLVRSSTSAAPTGSTPRCCAATSIWARSAPAAPIPNESGRAARRGRGEVSVTGVQTCSLPISSYGPRRLLLLRDQRRVAALRRRSGRDRRPLRRSRTGRAPTRRADRGRRGILRPSAAPPRPRGARPGRLGARDRLRPPSGPAGTGLGRGPGDVRSVPGASRRRP